MQRVITLVINRNSLENWKYSDLGVVIHPIHVGYNVWVMQTLLVWILLLTLLPLRLGGVTHSIHVCSVGSVWVMHVFLCSAERYLN